MTNQLFNYTKITQEQKALEKKIKENNELIESEINQTVNCLFTDNISKIINTTIPEQVLIDRITPLYVDRYARKNIKLSHKAIDFLINSNLKKLKKEIFQLEIKNIKDYQYIDVTNLDLEKINKIIPHTNIAFVKEHITSFYGKYKLNEQKHNHILDIINNNHINLSLVIYRNIEITNLQKKQTNIEYESLENIFNNPQFKAFYNSKEPKDKERFMTNILIESINNGNIDNYFFLRDEIYKLKINLKTIFSSKQNISDILAKGHKHPDFFNILNDILIEVPIDIFDHLFVRASLSMGHYDTFKHIINYYSNNDIINLKPIFQQVLGENPDEPSEQNIKHKRYRSYKTVYDSIYSKLLLKAELDLLLPEKNKEQKKLKL